MCVEMIKITSTLIDNGDILKATDGNTYLIGDLRVILSGHKNVDWVDQHGKVIEAFMGFVHKNGVFEKWLMWDDILDIPSEKGSVVIRRGYDN